jgi:hypothetical protein
MFACRKTPRPRKRNLVAPVLSSLINLPTFKPSNLQTPLCVSPFLATLTDDPQLTENAATLSPVPATLTSRVKHNPFVCHSYKKHRGWGTSFNPKSFLRFPALPSLTQIHLESALTKKPRGSTLLVQQVRVGQPILAVLFQVSPLTDHGSRTTTHQSLSPVESALPQNAPATPVESTLPKHST